MIRNRLSSLGAWVRLALLAGAAFLAGCAVAPPQVTSGRGASCHALFARVDQAVAAAGVADTLAARIAGFPYLRADRFLASYAGEALQPAAHAEWIRRMRALDQDARAIELANLPRGAADAAALEGCAIELAAADRSDPAGRERLRNAVVVPDAYSTAQRVAGLYWLSRIPFASGVRRWHEEVRETFAAPLAALPEAGELKRYSPPGTRRATPEVAAIIERASANPLGIPTPHGQDLDALFETFAPVYSVDTAGGADIPGRLAWGDAGVAVAPGTPIVYRRVSHARHAGRVLLQLNYWLWFPERPMRGAWDLLGGRLDGLLWRVTLSQRGEPLIFDTIHACGCYHLFIPTARAMAKAQPTSLDEPAFVPQVLAALPTDARLELRLASGTHYLQRVVVREDGARGATVYAFAEDDSLRSLPQPRGGRRSAFRPDGIIEGSERGERWLFWPMGVAESGAMRQWGHHATAFVGRRHFDDPGLLSRYFDLVIMP